MTAHTNDSDGSEHPFSFPNLHLADLTHLQNQYNLHGRDRVIGWLQTKLAVPLRCQFDDNFDEEEYWEAAVEHYVDTETELEEDDQ